MKFATSCDSGKVKDRNEDSVAVNVMEDNHLNQTRDAGLFVLADGAGGEDAGEVASYIATSVIINELSELLYSLIGNSPSQIGIDLGDQFYESESEETDGGVSTVPDSAAFIPEKPSGDEIRDALETATMSAHRTIRRYASETGKQPATTVVAGIYHDGTLDYIWAGDSRAYVLNTSAERLDLLTKDHSHVQEMEDAGVIDETEAMVHREGNKIKSALGIPDPTIETASIDLYEDDILVFTSDGIIDAYPHYPDLHEDYQEGVDPYRYSIEAMIHNSVMTDTEIKEVLLDAIGRGDTSESDLKRAAGLMMTLGNNRGGKDNMSLILSQSETFAQQPDELPPRGVDAPEQEITDINEAEEEDGDGSDAQSTSGEDPPRQNAGNETDTSTESNASSASSEPKSRDYEGESELDQNTETGEAGTDSHSADSELPESDSDDDEQSVERESGGEGSSDASEEESAPDADGNDRTGTESNSEDSDPNLILRSLQGEEEDSEKFEATPGAIIGSGDDAEIQFTGTHVNKNHVRLEYEERQWHLAGVQGGGQIFILDSTGLNIKARSNADSEAGTGFKRPVSDEDIFAIGKPNQRFKIEFND